MEQVDWWYFGIGNELESTNEIKWIKGAEIRDTDGNLICIFDADVSDGDFVEVHHFRDWQIPIPKTGDEIHPAIKEFIDGTL